MNGGSGRPDHRRPRGDAERAVAEQQPADGARDGRDGGEDQDPSAEYLADAGLLRVDPPPFDLRFDEDALHAINEARTIARRWAGLLCIYCHFEPLLLRRRMTHVPGADRKSVG